ncbi:MAG TPA: four helix bundle protein [Pirellulales bacterium]
MNGGQGNEKPVDLRERTTAFAVRTIKLYCALPKSNVLAQVIGKQLLRSGTSVGAQYREAARARSQAEFISKIESALQELEETQYWLELLIEAGMISEGRLHGLIDEANQLTKILVASVRTSKRRRAEATRKG